MSLIRTYFYLFFCIATLIFSKTTVAQNNIETVRILEQKSKKVVDKANILFYLDGKIVTMERSDDFGVLKYNVLLKFDSAIIYKIGYKRVVKFKNELIGDVFLVEMPNVLNEVIITGQIVPGNKYQSPFKLKFFNKQDIQNKQATNLADFLNSENNFQITQDPILGSKVSLYGMTGQDIKILKDGIPIIGRLNGSVDLSQILLNDIDRIEIVDGPLSVIYGTNATGGVINLITKTREQNSQKVGISTYAESVGVININADFGFNYKNNQTRFGIGRNIFLGWDPYSDSLKSAVKPIWRDVSWNPKEQYFANLSYLVNLSNKNTLHFRAEGFWENILDKQNPSSAYQTTVLDYQYLTTRYSLGASYNNSSLANTEFLTSLYYNYFDRNTIYNSQNLLKYDYRYLSSNNEILHNIFLRSTCRYEGDKKLFKIISGLETNFNNGLGTKITNGQASIISVAIFSMMNYQFSEKFFIQPGIRYEYNSNYLTPIAPTFNFRYNPFPILSTRFSYSRGYRTPEIKELYFNFVDNNHNIKGNPNLKTEKNTVNYSTSFTFTFINKNDAIEIVPVNTLTNEFVYSNIGKLNSYGIILDNTVKYQNFKFTFGGTMLGLSKRFSNTINQIDQILWTPSVNFNVNYVAKKIDTRFNLLLKYTGKNTYPVLNPLNNKVEVSSIPDFVMLDFNVGKKFFKNSLDVVLGVKNIFNIKNLKVTGFNGDFHSNSGTNQSNFLWGRTAFLSLNLNLEKND